MNVNQVGHDRRLAVIQAILADYGLRVSCTCRSTTTVLHELTFCCIVRGCHASSLFTAIPIPFQQFHLQSRSPRASIGKTFSWHAARNCDTGLSTFIIRMCNLKVADLNHTNRVENEVACSALAREALNAAGLDNLVPNIYAWRKPNLFEEAEEENFGWSICEFKIGKNLDTEFPTLSTGDQQEVMLQLADIYSALQKAVLPPTADKFGGLTFDSHENMVSGQTAMRQGGPWATLSDFWTERLRVVLDGAKSTSFLRISSARLFERLEGFLSEGGLADMLRGVDTAQRCLIHSDFSE